jgi:hypothetical protein
VFGGTGDDYLSSAIQTPDGGYITVGSTNSNNGDVSANKGKRDIWIVKLDASGKKEWERSYGGSDNEAGSSTTKTTDGNYVVAGYTMSNDGDVSGNQGHNDVFVFKIDVAGKILWQKTLGGTGAEFTSDQHFLTGSSDGGCVLAIETESNDGDVSGNNGSYDVWVVKLNQSGDIVWNKTFGGLRTDTPSAITASADGGYVIVGTTQSADLNVNLNQGSWDVLVLKIDASGNKVWQQTFGGHNIDWAHSITPTSDNGFVIAGTTLSTNGDVTNNKGLSDAWILKIDASGKLLWQKTFVELEMIVLIRLSKQTLVT